MLFRLPLLFGWTILDAQPRAACEPLAFLNWVALKGKQAACLSTHLRRTLPHTRSSLVIRNARGQLRRHAQATSSSLQWQSLQNLQFPRHCRGDYLRVNAVVLEKGCIFLRSCLPRGRFNKLARRPSSIAMKSSENTSVLWAGGGGVLEQEA